LSFANAPPGNSRPSLAAARSIGELSLSLASVNFDFSRVFARAKEREREGETETRVPTIPDERSALLKAR